MQNVGKLGSPKLRNPLTSSWALSSAEQASQDSELSNTSLWDRICTFDFVGLDACLLKKLPAGLARKATDLSNTGELNLERLPAHMISDGKGCERRSLVLIPWR